jgi:hypothetical protein
MSWDYVGTPPSQKEVQLQRYLESIWNRSDISTQFARLWGLYLFLQETHPASSLDLFKSVRKNNEPFFTRDQARIVWNTLFSKSQSGGAFADNLGKFIYVRMKPFAPSVFNTFESIYAFATLPFTILNSIKEETNFGPFIDWGIQNYSKLLPKLFSALEPFMVAGTVATMGAGSVAFIGQAIAAGNAALLHMTINEPVSAFLALVTAIPLLGPPITNMLQQVETGFDDLQKQRTRIGQTIFAGPFEEYFGAYMDELRDV